MEDWKDNMAAQSSIFPIFLRAEYREEANGIPKFISSIRQAANVSEAELKRVGTALSNALTTPRTGAGALDLGVPQLRELIRSQEQAAIAAREVANATKATAIANADLRSSLVPTVRAYFDLARAKEQDVEQSRRQLAALEAVQAQVNQTASVTSVLTGENLRLAQAEAGAANGARLLAAINRETGIELSRTTKSAKESAAAFDELFGAQQRLAALRTSERLDPTRRILAGVGAVDRNALSDATLDDVVRRTNRGTNPLVDQQNQQQAVAAQALVRAQEELAASAARLTAQIDPLVAAQQRYDATLVEASRLLAAGALSTEQYAQAQSFAASQLALVEAQVSGTAAAEALRSQQLREAEAAQRGLASAAAELRSQLDPMFAAQQRFDQELARADALLAAGTISAREYAQAQELARQNLNRAAQEAAGVARATDEVTRAQRAGTTARGSVINSVRAERVAFIQLGQQLQDVSIQAQMGTDAFLIFGQQVPQAAFALSGLSDSSNDTLAKVGEFATFLSGPWGAALFAATAFLGPLVFEMLGFGEETEKATAKTYNFAEGLDVLKLSADDATNAIDQLTDSLRAAIELQGSLLRNNITIARQELEATRAEIQRDEEALARLKAQPAGPLDTLFPSLSGPASLRSTLERRQVEARLQANKDKLGGLLEANAAADIVELETDVRESGDRLLKELNRVDAEIAKLDERRRQTIVRDDPLSEGGISKDEFRRQRTALIKERDSLEEQQREAKRRPRKPPRARVNREPEQLDRFAEQTAERVARINDRFSEQTRLVTQSLQANRELDNIIAATNDKMAKAKSLTADQRKEFEGIIAAAEATRDTIDAALLRPFEDLKRESEERLQVERLLAQGRTDEAAALQTVLQLQRQIGTETELRAALEEAIAANNKTEIDRIQGVLSGYQERMETVRETVIAEQRLTRELRDQQAVFQAQLGVVQTVRRDLTDILSGRNTDFFGNFQQALQDLQGQKLFERIFGQTFRDIENELQSQTPLGRANKAFADNVDQAADTTLRLTNATENLVDSFNGAAESIRNGVAAANDNGGFNPQLKIAETALKMAGINLGGNEITVTAQRNRPTDISRSSTIDIAARISRGISESLGAELEGVFGPRFAEMFGSIVGGVIVGKATGGDVGAVLGGAKGVFDAFLRPDKGFDATLRSGFLSDASELLGKAGAGAAQGTQIDGIIKALGIRGSKTGAQIGGAIGSAIPIPGAAQVGAALGSIIGGLIKGVPRGSATIGGSGSSLGITGIVGSRGSLKEASGDLANSVLDSIGRIAEQLGATVNASAGRVSIGQRKDNLRVDTSGRGATKIGNGAIDFGDDAEAAIAFAVRDLIQDGVITGLKASELTLLKAGKDIEAALQDVLTFRSVSDRLQQIKDPVGFAIGQLNREFEGLIDLFERAGATSQEFADLEELYGLERARALEEAADRVSSSLQQLLNDLKVGDSGLSLRARRANALTEFNGLATRVAAGDSSAFDDFADISQQLLDIERQLFGSTQSYFDRLAQITALTETAIAGQSNVTPIANNLPSPFDERNNIARTIEATGAEQVSILRAINDNLIIAINSNAGGFGAVSNFRGSILPNQIANY